MSVPSWFPALSPRPAPGGGTRFSVRATGDAAAVLLLYDAEADREPARRVPARRDGEFWTADVPDASPGALYAWSVRGDPRPVLDPYALALTGPERFVTDDPARAKAPRRPLRETNADAAWKCVVVAPPEDVSWKRPGTPWEDTVLYELHVRGFTRDPSSGVAQPGTYRGLVEKIPYLRELGVNAVEWMPCHEFDETDRRPPGGARLVNFWGYDAVGWLAPMRRYAADAESRDGPVREVRETVRALHDAGIRVILDVVFNHTAEQRRQDGPRWSFGALDEDAYYLHDAEGRRLDLTGCKNTVRCAHPAVRALVLDALRWWHVGLGVDGFRFDLATILCRDDRGALTPDLALLRAIEDDPWLSRAILVAEPWDAAGGRLVEDWPGEPRWSVWNDRFRDDVRRAWFSPSSREHAQRLATRLCGSEDQFGRAGGPPRAIAYVAAHDGFTLKDAVSYARKRNESNGEGGRDGSDHEVSYDHGVEGPGDASIEAARDRTRRNLLACLLLAQGVPMLLSGDEIGRTQRGNNNAYCHDGPLTWVDWTGVERDAGLLAFAKSLIALRRDHRELRRPRFLRADDVAWLGPDDWEGAFAYALGRLLVAVNLREEERTWRLPPGTWRLALATAEAAEPSGGEVTVPARSVAVLRR